MSFFIPAFHFVPADKKLTPEWCKQAINYSYHNYNNKSLLEGKNISEIDKYAAGDYDMTPFKRMFKSLQKKEAANNHPNMDKNYLDDATGVDWTPYPLITTKVNAAVNLVQKIPIEVTCTALDPLAMEKKKKDISFLTNKGIFENDLQELSDNMGIGKVDLGTTEHSSIPFSDSPYGLDLSEPDELAVFENLLYALKVEAAFETCLQQFYELKAASQVKLLEINDQFKYGVSCHRTFNSAITGLPDLEYVFPDDVLCPPSFYPDFRDNPHRFIRKRITVLELANYFSNEMPKDEQALYQMINGKVTGYCACNKMPVVDPANFGEFKVNLLYCEIKSVDWIGVGAKNKGMKYFSSDNASEKLWGQNTYCFYWLQNTDYFFGIHKLDYAHREKGREAFQGFSTNIYKSQKKSAVELAIKENKKATFAGIKLEHAIIKSAPSGTSIDLAFIRGAVSGLITEGGDDDKKKIQELLNLAFEENKIVGDSSGFENKIQNGYKPVDKVTGGLDLNEVSGYLEIIRVAKQNISDFTGINDQLSGSSSNAEGLIGLQKLLINSSLNALYYCNEAVKEQYSKLLTAWASYIKISIKEGGAAKEAIKSMIGAKKLNLVEGIEDIPLHDIGVFITVGQREEERQKFNDSLSKLDAMGALTVADKYMLSYITNPKDAFALLAVREKQFNKRQADKEQQQFANQQQIVKQQGQNVQQQVQTKTQGDIQKIYAQGDVQSKLLTLANQLGLNVSQFNALVKASLQQDRSKQQTDKAVQTLQTKSDLSQQEALAGASAGGGVSL